MGFVEGLLGLVVLIADVWAIINVIGSRGPTTAVKFVWILLILLLPVLGLIIWLVAGPRKPNV